MDTILIIVAILIAIGWLFSAGKSGPPHHRRGNRRRNRCRCRRQ